MHKQHHALVHGLSKTKIFRVWNTMMQRCYNKNSSSYARYGAKGITVDSSWHNVKNFIADMGNDPNGLTLDRVDNSKGYSKENCRWATRKQQNNNKNNTPYFSFEGLTLCLTDWLILLGINKKQLVRSRIHVGWNFVNAVTTIVQIKYRNTTKLVVKKKRILK